MHRGWSAVLLALVLSGCSDPGPAMDEEAPGADAADQAAGDARVARPGDSLAAATTLPDPIELAWDGAIDAGACAPSGLNSCMGASVPLASGKTDSLFLDSMPASWTGTLNLFWDASSPATSELGLGLTFYESCGSGCYQSVGGGAYLEGSSPLVLDVDHLEAPSGSEGLWISVRQTRLTPDPVYGHASIGQDFRVDGLIEPSQPAADGT
ncbi:MAG: hypothetical protein QOC71_822 [Thermoplasmata archaeon]|jgi:hypothetical protein|nr:hypothetical protein [Thermoplasmata archaeon]